MVLAGATPNVSKPAATGSAARFRRVQTSARGWSVAAFSVCGRDGTNSLETKVMAINGSWKTPALSAFGAVLLLLIGWIATAATTDRDRMSAEIASSIQ